METLYVGGTPAATGVEALASAFSSFSTTEWLWLAGFAVVPGVLAGALAVLGHRDDRPDMVSRELADLAERHRGADRGGADLALAADGALFVAAITGLAAMFVSPDPVVQWVGGGAAVVCALTAMGLGWISDR